MFKFLLLIIAAGISIMALGTLALLAIVPIGFLVLLSDRHIRND